MNPIQKLAKFAFENPELRGDLVPLLKKLAGTYTPKDNWVLLDLAVQDAHKGKPAREWYRKDEGYTEVYDRTVKELKRKGRRATHRLTQRDIKDAILNNHSILETLKADSDADPRWVATLEKQIEGLRRLLEQAEMKRVIQASKWELADLVETMTSARSTPRDRMAQMDAATKLYERIHGKALNTRPEKEDRDIVDDLKGLDRRGQIQEAKDVSRGVKNPGVLFAMAQAAKDVKAWGAHSTFVYNGIRRLEGSPEYKRFIEDLPIRKASDPRLAASHGAQRDLIAVLRGPEMREAVRKAVIRYAANTNRTVVVNAAVEDILNSTSWDTEQLQAVLAKHTAGKETP